MKKIIKRGMRKTFPRMINFFIVLLMLFQPVGTPGLYVAVAEAPASSDAVQAVQGPAPAETVTEPKTETVIETTPPPAPSVPIAPTAPSATNTAPSPSLSDPATGGTGTTGNTAAGKIDPEAAFDEKPGTPAPAPDLSGQECLSDGVQIEDSARGDWNVNEVKGTAETKKSVELGVKYIFPLDEKVTVTFSCLPKDPDKRTPLKIEKINTSDINLPEGISAATEFAYDITTGMDNGDFKYDVTLPKTDVSDTEVNYIEKSASEVKDENLSNSDLKSIDDSKVREENNVVKVEDLNHFTVFIVTWNFNDQDLISDIGSSVNNLAKNLAVQGATMDGYYNGVGGTGKAVKAKQWRNGNGTKYWQVEFNSSGYSTLTLSSKQKSSVTGPKKFKIEYKIGSGGSWSDVPGGTNITVVNNFTSGVISNLSLPFDTENQPSVFLRWIMTSNTAVNGDPVENGGTSGIDDIIVQGESLLIASLAIPVGIDNSWDCFTDSDGANDEPGQKDLTKLCQNPSASNPLQVTWNWDVISMPGSNTADACSLFDTDNNGNADYAMCVTWDDARNQISGSPVLYSCTDTRADRCTGSVVMTITHGSTCDVDLSNDDPFLAGDSSPNDTKALCSINLDDVGGANKTKPIDVCSYPSTQPNSDPSDCVLISTDKGNLEVIKDVIPDDPATNWNIAVTGGPDPFSDTLTGDDSTGINAVSAGTYSIAETAGSNTNLNNYDSTYSCTKNGSAFLSGNGSSISNVSIAKGDVVLCTFTNTVKTGALVVHKTFTDQHSNSGITINVSPGALSQATDSNGDATFSNLTAGTYSATAVEPAGYYESANTCNGVSITAGQTANCTITDSPILGTITVHKNIIGGNATPSQFCFTLNPDPGNGQICASNLTGNAVFSNIPVGTYGANETVTASDYTQTGNTCSNLTITNNGDSRSCEVTNTRDTGSVTVHKQADIDGDGNFETADSGANTLGFQWGLDGTPNQSMGATVSSVETGSHSVSENSVTNYHFVGWYTTGSTSNSCANPEGTTLPISVSVTKDPATDITLCNAHDTGTLEVKKSLSPSADPGLFNLQIDSVTKKTDASNNDTTTAITVLTGIHTVSELAGTSTVLSDYNSSISCTDGSSGDGTSLSDVSVAEGSNIICTITNTRKTGRVLLQKIVNGGTALPGAWTFNISGVPDDYHNGDGVTLNTGTYTVSESGPDGYTPTSVAGICSGLNGSDATLNVTEDGGACTFYNSRDTGDLQVKKAVDDGSDLTQWSFSLDDGAYQTVNSSGFYDFGQVATLDNHTIFEKGPDGYTLGSVSCTNAFTDNQNGSVTTTVDKDETTLCTFNNNINKGSITIIKDSVPNNGQVFLYSTASTTSDDLGNFTLVDDGDGISNIKSFSPIFPGTYDVSEALSVLGWDLTKLECTEDKSQNSTTSLLIGKATIVVDPGENVTCTFTNTERGSIKIVKNTIGDDGTFSYTSNFGVSSLTTSNNTAEQTVDNLVPGTGYNISETGQTGWDQDSAICNRGTIDAIEVVPGETTTCTFTNIQRGSITIVKNTVGGDGTFNYTGDLNNFSLTTSGGTVSQKFDDLVFGTFNVTESNPAPAYDLTSLSCIDPDDGTTINGATAVIDLDPGENVTCTFTNTKRGHLIVQKTTLPSGDTTEFSITASGSGTITGGGAGTITDITDKDYEVTPGIYNVAETVPSGWSKTGDTCQSVVVAAGETKYCEITNTKLGNIIIEKVTVGGDDSFEFDPDWNATNFYLSDGESNDSGLLSPGTYSVNEVNIPAGWDKTGVTCSDGSNNPSLIELDPNETVTCTFTNTKRGKIVVDKVTDPSGDPQSFQIGVYDSQGLIDFFGLTDADTPYESGGLLPGSGYDVIEQFGNFNGWWDFDYSSQCVGSDDGRTMSYQDFELRAGETVTCTIKNIKKGSISGVKWEDTNGDGTKDAGEPQLNNWTVFIDDNDNGVLDAGERSTVTADIGNGPGEYLFDRVLPNTYSVCEVEQSDWQRTYPTAKNCQDVTVEPGADSENTNFGNFELGKITVCKYNDYNGDGNYDPQNDKPLSGISIMLSKDDAGKWALEDSKETGENGCVTFSDLAFGKYRVEEDYTDPDLGGYYSTNGVVYHDVDIKSGSEENKIFLNALYRTISGTKFNDLNGNGTRDAGEPGLENWTIFIDYNNNGVLDGGEPSTTTDANGDYEFTNLVSDSYTIAEVLEPGWTQTMPATGHYDVDVHTAITSTGNDFGNVQLTDIHGYKWEDLDENGIQNGDEPKLSGWEIFIDKNDNSIWDEGEPRTATSSDPDPQHFGWYWFEDLLPGQYKVCETQQAGWTQTYPSPQCHTINLPNDCNEYAENGLVARVSTPNFVETFCEFHFGNHFTPPNLTIEKFNSQWPTVQDPGDIIDYTITVRALKNNVNEVVVTDLPPEGFKFIPGSENAISSLGGGHIGALALSHAYASPGTWSLGNVQPDEVITLTYKAKINNGQQPGTYNDLAWADGTDGRSVRVLATSVPAPTPDDGVITDNFVGTQIALAVPGTPQVVELEDDTKTETKTKRRVLGVTTFLPATGSNTGWMVLALVLLLAGISLLIAGRKKRENDNIPKDNLMKVMLFALIGTGMVFSGIGSPVQADVVTIPPSIRLEQPDTPTDIQNLDIGFVVLDVEGRAMDVDCWRDGPSDAVPVKFATVHVDAGGNSGVCPATMGVDGAYDFYAKVTAGTDTANSGTSTVVLASDAPGTPLNYDRDGDSCNLTFTTANDGLTAKVELYRSVHDTFTADASTFSKEVTIGPNENGSLTDPLGNCEDYFYAIRAVSAAGVGSGFVGDEDVNVETRTRTRTTRNETIIQTGGGAIPVTGGGAVAGQAAEEGNVAGENVEQGQIEGAETQQENLETTGWLSKIKNNWPWIVVALLVLWYLYHVYKKRSPKKPIPPAEQ